MKKIKFCIPTVVLVILSALLSFAACGDEESYNNIECSAATVVYDGNQTITLTSSTPYGEGEAALFKDSISASDISLTDALQGKIVSAVKYVSETEIEVTLAGTTTQTPMGNSVSDTGRIYVSSNALKTSGSGYCVVTVIEAELRFRSSSTHGSGSNLVIEETYVLQGGSFAADVEDFVALKDGESGTLSVSVSGSEITFTVSGCSSQTVVVVVSAQATTIGKEFTLKLGIEIK